MLTFEGNSDLGTVSYSVEDETEATVATGTLSISLNSTSTINIGTLNAGTYTLYIEVGGQTYWGEFTVPVGTDE